ncbi:hypothetical protein F511_04010 [Dorcoceras hygrometricum]|uniref:Uncharacterized protein n=1 Tax=Dorcoceras hygrometricum TaxID=472368 RepID=A0A2Z7A6T9_9LAMI|nr:hypothetical protein F511_04010 [Dorcoceras hygrometricum]
MDSFRDDTEETQFFDALEHITPEPDSKIWDYDMWIGTPQSVRDRRAKFVKWMEMWSDEFGGENYECTYGNSESGIYREHVKRDTEDSGYILRTSSIVEEISCCPSSSSKNMDGLELKHGINLSECRNEEIENVSVLCSSVQKIVQSEVEGNEYTPRTMSKLKDRWWCRLRSINCMTSGNVEDDNVSSNFSQAHGTRVQRVNVRHNGKSLKELSALFAGQEIQAHRGSILTMKFSLDGQYLASGAEDKLVKVWRVVEDERLAAMDIPDVDPSCLYFSMNQLCELRPLMVEKDELERKTWQKTMESACIVLPPKIFRILETPLHVFQGHSGRILDLSWAQNNCLLSSSVDKTVRLWQLGVDQCLMVFHHSDYVTCIQFNPVNDDYFISGSIDGIVRIWSIDDCQVVDWTETRDIITAISFRPDGKAGVVGLISGMCHFFTISDNHLQLESQMCLNTKKSLCKRITGFQYLLQDPSNVLVTSADSHIRIINGTDVIAKYKGPRSAGNHISASFTSDGKHIISACDDSNVCFWNFGQKDSKAIYKSFECFSSDASVVLPWPGSRIVNSGETLKSRKQSDNSIQSLPTSSHFSLSQDFILDSGSKGSATWPEEKLPTSNLNLGAYTCSMSKSQYKLFKTSCQSLTSSHAWGLVIVTGGLDGRIRSFYNYGLPAPV